MDNYLSVAPGPVDNSNLICKHKDFAYRILSGSNPGFNKHFIIVNEQIWESIVKCYKLSTPEDEIFLIHRNNHFLELHPPICNECSSPLHEIVHITVKYLQEKCEKEYLKETFENLYVDVLKEDIAEHFGTPLDGMMLLFGDVPLGVNVKLSDYGITTGTILELIECTNPEKKEIGFEGTTLQRPMNS